MDFVKPLVDRITSVGASTFSNGYQDYLFVNASGEVNTTGWTNFYLFGRVYVTPPKDGFWDFDLCGDAPTGTVGNMVVPIVALNTLDAPSWVTGVRIHSMNNYIEQPVANIPNATLTNNARAVAAGNVIFSRDLASFDDSIQPTGTVHWSGLVPHIEMKKLHHVLTLVITGPDQQTMQQCFSQAATAAIIAAVVAAYATGGLGLSAAISAFVAALEGCLGNAYDVTVTNNSHWVYWDT